MNCWLALGASLACGAVSLAQESPRIADITGLRDLDARAPIAIGVHAPGVELAGLVDRVRDILTPSAMAAVIERLQRGSPRQDVNLATLADWDRLGFDPSGDFAALIAEPGGFLGLPREVVAVAPVSDVARFEAFLAGQVDVAGAGVDAILRGTEPTTAALSDTIWSFFGDRALVLARGGLLPEVLRERMKVRVAAFGSGEGIGAREVYRHLRRGLDEVPFAACYFRSSYWRFLPYPAAVAGDPGEDGPLGDAAPPPGIAPAELSWEGMVAAGHRSIRLALQLPATVREQIQLSTEADPTERLRAWQDPDLELVLRVANPVSAARALGFEPARVGMPEPLMGVFEELQSVGSLSIGLWQEEGAVRPSGQVLVGMTHGAAALRLRDGLVESTKGLEVREETVVLEDAREVDIRIVTTPLGDFGIAVHDSWLHVGDYDHHFLDGVRGKPKREVEPLGDRLLVMRARLAPWLTLAKMPIEPVASMGRVRLDLLDNDGALLADLTLVGVHAKMSFLVLLAAGIAMAD